MYYMSDSARLRDWLDQCLEAIRRIEERIERVEKPEDFVGDDHRTMTLDSICMMLIVLSESLKRINRATDRSLEVRFPEVPWGQFIDTRNFLAHEYFGVDYAVVFDLSKFRIGEVKEVVLQLVSDLNESSA